MNFFLIFFFKNTKLKKYENLNNFKTFLLVLFIEDEIDYIMKIKGPFMKVVSLNETIKHQLFKPNFDIGILFDSF